MKTKGDLALFLIQNGIDTPTSNKLLKIYDKALTFSNAEECLNVIIRYTEWVSKVTDSEIIILKYYLYAIEGKGGKETTDIVHFFEQNKGVDEKEYILLLNFLGTTPEIPPKDSMMKRNSLRTKLDEFMDYLEDVKGLKDTSAKVYFNTVSNVLDEGVQTLQELESHAKSNITPVKSFIQYVKET